MVIDYHFNQMDGIGDEHLEHLRFGFYDKKSKEYFLWLDHSLDEKRKNKIKLFFHILLKDADSHLASAMANLFILKSMEHFTYQGKFHWILQQEKL